MKHSTLLMIILAIGCSENTVTQTQESTPSITNVTISSSDDSIKTSSELNCLAEVMNETEETGLVYIWTNEAGDILGDEETLQLSPETIKPNDELSCTVSLDGASETDAQMATITVENTEPSISTVMISPEMVMVDSLAECTFMAEDPDLETLTNSYIWTQNGNEVGTESTLQLSADTYTAGDVIACTVRVEDLAGDSATSTVEVVIEAQIIENTPPIIQDVELSPNPAKSNDDITCTPNGVTDAEEDEVTISFAWSVNGEPVEENTDTLSGPFMVGAEVSCIAIPNDGQINGESVTNSVTIINSIPSVGMITFSEGPVYTDGVISVNAELNDSDNGQTLSATYAWHVIDSSENNVDTEIQSGPETSLDGIWFDRDDQVYVIITPNDGVDDGMPIQSESITIQNSLPVITSVTLSPESAAQGEDDLNCAVMATDLDNDVLTYTYQWSNIDGEQTVISEVTDLSNVRSANELSHGTWTCTVIPHDGLATGSSSSASALVESKCGSVNIIEPNQWVSVADHPNLDVGTESSFTAELWVKFSNLEPETDAALISKSESDSFETADYELYIDSEDGMLTWQIGPTSEECSSLKVPASSSLRLNQWQHIAATIDHLTGGITLFINGNLMDSCVPVSPTGSAKNPSNNGSLLIGNRAMGMMPANAQISAVNLSNSVKYSESFTPQIDLLDDGSLASWRFQQASGAYDRSGNDLDGELVGSSWLLSCPEADRDADGVAEWQDCDDEDENLTLALAGDSAACAGLSCAQLAHDGFIQDGESGNYWIDPNGTGPFETYCDMSPENSGWTLVAKIQSGADSQWTYDSPIWTTPGTEFNDTDYTLDSGEAKYRAFDTVPFEEIKLQDPVSGNMMILAARGESLVSFMASQADNTEANVSLAVQNDPSTISYLGFNTSYNICDGHLTTFLADGQYSMSFNVSGRYEATGNTATGSVRIGYWGSGSNAWNWQWTSDCAIGLGLKTYGYQGTSESGTSFGTFTQLWVR